MEEQHERFSDADFFIDYPMRPGSGMGAFQDLMRGRFVGLDDAREDRLTFRLAIVGGPWRQEWDGPDYGLSDRDETARQELIGRAISEARTRERGFYVTGFSPAVGADWIGVTAGRGRDETRAFDRVPVVATTRRYRDEGFTPTWFLETFAGTIYTAAALFPQTHPDLRVVGIMWSIENPLEVPLIVSDAANHRRRFPPTDDEPKGVLSGVVRIGDLTERTDELVQTQMGRFRRTVLTRYGVPTDLW